MALTIKETNKKDVKIKNASIVDGKFFHDGAESDLVELLGKVYPEGETFELNVTAKSESEVDLEDNEK